MTPTITVLAGNTPVSPSPFATRIVSIRASWDATAAIGWSAPKPTMRTITRAFAEDTDFSVAQLIGPCRSQSLARARQELMWILRRQGRWSLPQIGRFLGCRDHTTILHGVRAHQKRLDEKASTGLVVHNSPEPCTASAQAGGVDSDLNQMVGIAAE